MPAKPTPMNGIVYVKEGVYDFNTAIFMSYYPEFDRLQTMVVYGVGVASISLLSIPAFGRMYDKAVALHTAHRLARLYDMASAYEDAGLQDQSSSEITTNTSASTSSLSEGSTPLQLATGDDPFSADLATTRYGLELLALIRVWVPGGELVSGEQIGRPLYGMQWPPVNSGY